MIECHSAYGLAAARVDFGGAYRLTCEKGENRYELLGNERDLAANVSCHVMKAKKTRGTIHPGPSTAKTIPPSPFASQTSWQYGNYGEPNQEPKVSHSSSASRTGLGLLAGERLPLSVLEFHAWDSGFSSRPLPGNAYANFTTHNINWLGAG